MSFEQDHVFDLREGDDQQQQQQLQQQPRRVRRRTTKDLMRKLIVDDLWSNDSLIQERALGALVVELREPDPDVCTENEEAFFQLGGHVTVVKVMKSHLDCCPNILKQGLDLLVTATCPNDERSTSIAQVGGMQVAMDVMIKCNADAQVQCTGLKVLNNLVCENEEYANFLLNGFNGANFICETMNLFSNDCNVVFVGCDLIKHLCRFEDIRVHFFQAKTLRMMASALERYEIENCGGYRVPQLMSILMPDNDC